MVTTTVELTQEEIVQRGKEIYYRKILPLLQTGNDGRVVAIDVCTGEFELAENALIGADQLRLRVPEAIIFFMRVGYPTMARVL